MAESPPGSFCAVSDDFSTYFECFGLHISALSLIFPGRGGWQKTWFRVHETLLGGVSATSASDASRCFWLASSSRRYFMCFCFFWVCAALLRRLRGLSLHILGTLFGGLWAGTGGYRARGAVHVPLSASGGAKVVSWAGFTSRFGSFSMTLAFILGLGVSPGSRTWSTNPGGGTRHPSLSPLLPPHTSFSPRTTISIC